jgi:hypothetical protein
MLIVFYFSKRGSISKHWYIHTQRIKLKELVLIYNHGFQKIKELVEEPFQDYWLFVGSSMKSVKSLGSVGKPKTRGSSLWNHSKNWNWRLLTKSNYHPTLAITTVRNENLPS